MRNESIFIAVVLLGALALGVSGCKVYRWTGHRDAWTPPTPTEVVPPPVDVYERGAAHYCYDRAARYIERNFSCCDVPVTGTACVDTLCAPKRQREVFMKCLRLRAAK